MPRHIAIVISATVVFSFLAAGCGGPSKAAVLRNRTIEASRLATAVRAREAAQTQSLRQTAIKSCSSKIGPLMTTIGDLNSRLDVGLTFSSYSDRVGSVRVAYDRIPPYSLTGPCLSAANAAAAAYNQYLDAYNIWNNCISSLSCTTNSVTPQLQTYWAAASTKVEKAKEEYAFVGLFAGPTGTWTREVPSNPLMVGHTVYGRALTLFCGVNTTAARAPACTDLKAVLLGGVAESEFGSLDRAVKELNTALGLEPTTTGS